MFDIRDHSDVRIEFYYRGDLPPPVRDQTSSIRDRLTRLQTSGVITEVIESQWDNRVPLTDCNSSLRDTYLSFRNWANDTDRTLFPYFSVRECYTSGASETSEWLVLPIRCMAVSVDEELEAVYPHRSASNEWTVEDGLDSLEMEQTEHQLTDSPGISAD